MATREEGTGRRELGGRQAGMIIGGLLLLLLLVYFFFLRGGGEDTVDVAPPPPAPTEVAPSPTDGPKKPGKDGPIETFELFASKDPFKPLISLTGTGTTGEAVDGGTDTDGDGEPDGTGDGTGDGSGDGNGDGGDGSGEGNGGGQQIDGRTVRLVDVFTENGEQRAQIQVDGTVYTVDEGERFAENFELLDISGQCASILYGDDQFTICEGEEILK